MSTFHCPGLQADNPLGLFAALGLLRVLQRHHVANNLTAPRLWFGGTGIATAFYDTALPRDAILDLVLKDAADQFDNPVLRLAYDNSGEWVAPDVDGAKWDLKPPKDVARRVLVSVASGQREHADLAGALFTDLIRDNNNNTKPTSFHFTAGQQAFLAMVNELRAGMSREDVIEALDGPWRNDSKLPSMAWDSSVSRNYALRAANPSNEKRGSVPAANWLAVQGLAYFPVFADRDWLRTACVHGGWKTSVFYWPVWTRPISSAAVAGLLRYDPRKWSPKDYDQMGIALVYSASILRSDQGGYGTFTPAAVYVADRPAVRGSSTPKTSTAPT